MWTWQPFGTEKTNCSTKPSNSGLHSHPNNQGFDIWPVGIVWVYGSTGGGGTCGLSITGVEPGASNSASSPCCGYSGALRGEEMGCMLRWWRLESELLCVELHKWSFLAIVWTLPCWNQASGLCALCVDVHSWAYLDGGRKGLQNYWEMRLNCKGKAWRCNFFLTF